ncbi:Neuropeptide-Like Protein [Caenorhabditis elegans]|uniref:Neuropeptide-Like Protein n=1 Tax=Caenorhabditis elegans TaxID=6239 RepID=A5HU91_CAEEL|nr:Neuropeptide-Like Protein [Caenorhabditis elegans]CCD63041.1 Neuropeptide-Like Protein [Caenorhabditis elegans]|eukprot:NP_001123197.1 Uncharacterized protein CELE_ZK813.7 [Caenorhabditis elegans]
MKVLIFASALLFLFVSANKDTEPLFGTIDTWGYVQSRMLHHREERSASNSHSRSHESSELKPAGFGRPQPGPIRRSSESRESRERRKNNTPNPLNQQPTGNGFVPRRSSHSNSDSRDRSRERRVNQH